MGNTSTKLAEKCTLLSKDEVPVVAGSFKFVSKNSDRIKEDDLMKIWGSQMDARLAQYITNFLFGGGGGGARLPHAGFQRFAELYVFCVRGTIDERIAVMLASFTPAAAVPGGGQATGGSAAGGGGSGAGGGGNSGGSGLSMAEENGAGGYEISYPLVKEFVEAVVSSYVRAIRLEGGVQFKSWESRGFHFVHECVQKLAESLSHELAKGDTQKVTRTDTETWLQSNPTLLCMLTHVFLHLFQYRSAKNSQQQQPRQSAIASATGGGSLATAPQVPDHLELADAPVASRRHNATQLLPVCEGLLYTPDFPACTDISQILFINAALPQAMRHKWRFLFSSQIHGESFSTLLGRIMEQGPSVLIVEDTDGYIYGGYATDSWTMRAKFTGSESAFLFTLRPRMRVFPSTGFNRNFQYLNLHQQTLPNGLGMGGQHEYWGLWLDSNYGIGQCSESCTTYRNYTQLSAKKTFTIRNLEVWGVGDRPVKEDLGTPERSVLDGNLEEKAILEMAGRSQYSEGYREDPGV